MTSGSSCRASTTDSMPERPSHDPHLGDSCTCFKCHIGSINISPAALPTRRNHNPPKPPSLNNYEKAEPRDARGMPFLGPDLKPISQKSLDATRRQREEAIRHPETVKDTKET